MKKNFFLYLITFSFILCSCKTQEDPKKLEKAIPVKSVYVVNNGDVKKITVTKEFMYTVCGDGYSHDSYHYDFIESECEPSATAHFLKLGPNERSGLFVEINKKIKRVYVVYLMQRDDYTIFSHDPERDLVNSKHYSALIPIPGEDDMYTINPAGYSEPSALEREEPGMYILERLIKSK